jgi:hypothetical protein
MRFLASTGIPQPLAARLQLAAAELEQVTVQRGAEDRDAQAGGRDGVVVGAVTSQLPASSTPPGAEQAF